MKLLNIKFLLLLCVLYLPLGCDTYDNSNIFENVPFPETTIILHEENLIEGALYLYKDRTGFRQSFFSFDKEIWLHSSNAEVAPNQGIDITMNNYPNIPILIFAGVITEDNIKK